MLNLETLIRIIVKEVIKEISKQEVEINIPSVFEVKCNERSTVINMDKYRTPVLTEKQMADISSEVIIVPQGTILTPGAREIIQKKKITIKYQTK